MTYSEQLEREAERDRADIEETLEELRGRLKPGQLVDQLFDYARDGAGAQFYDNLKRQIVDNPLPVTMIGAGLAWLAISNGMSHRRGADGAIGHGRWHGRSATDRLHAGETGANRAGEGMSRTARETTEAIGDSYRSVADTERTGAEQMRARAAGMADTVQDSMERARRSIADTGQAFADFSREQPLVMAALGVAIGAALGAALPSTEAESRVMGDAADNAKAKVREVVEEQTERMKDTAHDAANRAADEMEETAESALDRMDHESEPTSDELRNREGDAMPSGSDSALEAERRFMAGERPSNG